MPTRPAGPGIEPLKADCLQNPPHFLSFFLGCGVGGIATAARLAQAGFAVTVFEKVRRFVICSSAGVGSRARRRRRRVFADAIECVRLTDSRFRYDLQNDYSGGRCSLIEQDGYVRPPLKLEPASCRARSLTTPPRSADDQRFDQGPSLLLLPDLFRQTYEDLGERMEDHLDLVKCAFSALCFPPPLAGSDTLPSPLYAQASPTTAFTSTTTRSSRSRPT